MHSAASLGNPGVGLLLLDRGAEPGKREDVNVALEKGHMEVVKFLCVYSSTIIVCKVVTEVIKALKMTKY